PARLALGGSSPTLSLFRSFHPDFTLPTLAPQSLSTPRFWRVSPVLPPRRRESLLRLSRRSFGDPRVTASFTPGYELSKPTDNAPPLRASCPTASGGNSRIPIIRPAPQTGHTRVGVTDDGLSRVSFVSSGNSGSGSATSLDCSNRRHNSSFWRRW